MIIVKDKENEHHCMRMTGDCMMEIEKERRKRENPQYTLLAARRNGSIRSFMMCGEREAG